MKEALKEVNVTVVISVLCPRKNPPSSKCSFKMVEASIQRRQGLGLPYLSFLAPVGFSFLSGGSIIIMTTTIIIMIIIIICNEIIMIITIICNDNNNNNDNNNIEVSGEFSYF